MANTPADNLILKAKLWAKKSHSGQTRKYTGEPYFNHPFRVACDTMRIDYMAEHHICAAFLHDVLEDCKDTYEELYLEFGYLTAHIVIGLTSYSKQIKSTANRRDRKKMDLEYLIKQSQCTKVIKMLDRIDNLEDFLETFSYTEYLDKDFLAMYCEETKQLLTAIGASDNHVADRLTDLIKRTESALR